MVEKTGQEKKGARVRNYGGVVVLSFFFFFFLSRTQPSGLKDLQASCDFTFLPPPKKNKTHNLLDSVTKANKNLLLP